MPFYAWFVAIGLVVVLVVVLGLSLSDRIGGQPRRSLFRRNTAPAAELSNAEAADALAEDPPLESDPNLAKLQNNTNTPQGFVHRI